MASRHNVLKYFMMELSLFSIQKSDGERYHAESKVQRTRRLADYAENCTLMGSAR
jgi:hypothetical protein